MARGQTRRDCLHLGLRRFKSLSLLDPPDGPAIAADARLHLTTVARDRRPNLGIARKFEIRRHYADNYRRRAVASFERAAHNPGTAAVALPPEAVTEDDYAWAVHQSLFIGERAPQHRLYAESREEINRHSCAGNDLYAFRFLQPDPAARIHGQLLERPALLLPIPEVRWRSPIGALLFLWIERFYGHESSRIVRKPPQQRGVDDAEDRRVRADAKRKCEYHNQRETGILHQYSRAVAQVLPKLFKPSHAASVAPPLLRLLHAAESLASRASRLFRTHPEPDVLLRLSLDVIAQLLIQLALRLRFPQQRA